MPAANLLEQLDPAHAVHALVGNDQRHAPIAQSLKRFLAPGRRERRPRRSTHAATRVDAPPRRRRPAPPLGPWHTPRTNLPVIYYTLNLLSLNYRRTRRRRRAAASGRPPSRRAARSNRPRAAQPFSTCAGGAPACASFSSCARAARSAPRSSTGAPDARDRCRKARTTHRLPRRSSVAAGRHDTRC